MNRTARTLALNLIVIAILVPGIYYGLVGMVALLIWQWASRYFKLNQEARILSQAQGINPANIYWGVLYDCRTTEVAIKGGLPKARYWSLVAYNMFTMPLDSYVFDETLQRDDDDRYTVYLTTRPRGRPNEIDVSAAPRGLVLIRTSFPEQCDTVIADTPEVHVLPWN